MFANIALNFFRFVAMYARSQCVGAAASRLTDPAYTRHQLGRSIQIAHHSTQCYELW